MDENGEGEEPIEDSEDTDGPMDEAIEVSEPEPGPEPEPEENNENEDPMPVHEEENDGGNQHPLSQFSAQQLIEMMDHMTGLKKSFDLLVTAFENYRGEAVAVDSVQVNEDENNEDENNENYDPEVIELPEEGEESNGKYNHFII